MSSTRIAAVIPYFQREPGILVRALRSIEAQEGIDDLVIVIVDDGSPIPASDELARWYGPRRFPVEVIRQRNGGPASARNRALDSLSDDIRYIAFLDSDDEWTPGHLAHAIQALSSGHDFYFADLYQLDQTVSAFKRAGRIDLDRHPRIAGSASLHRFDGDMFGQILTGNVIGTPAVVLDRKTLGDLRFNQALVNAGEDYLFWMACARRNARFCFSTEVEVRCGSGVNVYARSRWGTESHLKRVHHEMRYRKILRDDRTLTVEQRRFVVDRIEELRCEFAGGMFHRIKRRASIDWATVKAQAALDPHLVIELILKAGSYAGAPFKRRGGISASVAPINDVAPEAFRAPDAHASPEQKLPSVFVSIVHWNGGESTIKCIRSVLDNGYANLSLVIVDNGSTDKALVDAALRWPEIAILRNERNLGFTGGQNIGIAHACERGAALVVLLNQDAVMKPGCIGEMVRLAHTDDRIGLLSPVVYFDDEPDRAQFSGSWIETKKLTVSYSRDPEAIGAREKTQGDSICLWGTALMIRAAMIEQIGMLDERFFAYYEDTDYSVRASKAGWRSRMCFDAGILHEGHSTVYSRPPHFFYLMVRNGFLFWRKTLSPLQYWRLIRIHLARVIHQAANLQDAGLRDQVQASVDGIWDAWHDRYGERDPELRAPAWFARLIMYRPYLLAAMLNFDFAAIGKEAAGRLFGRGPSQAR